MIYHFWRPNRFHPLNRFPPSPLVLGFCVTSAPLPRLLQSPPAPDFHRWRSRRTSSAFAKVDRQTLSPGLVEKPDGFERFLHKLLFQTETPRVVVTYYTTHVLLAVCVHSSGDKRPFLYGAVWNTTAAPSASIKAKGLWRKANCRKPDESWNLRGQTERTLTHDESRHCPPVSSFLSPGGRA